MVGSTTKMRIIKQNRFTNLNFFRIFDQVNLIVYVKWL